MLIPNVLLIVFGMTFVLALVSQIYVGARKWEDILALSLFLAVVMTVVALGVLLLAL